MAKDPNAVAAKWAIGLQNATQTITDGVNAVTEAPGAAAARQVNVWAQNTAAAKEKWAQNVGSVSLASWKSDMINKGIGRIGPGATAAQPKVAAFMVQLLPAVQASVNSLPARGTFQQNVQRMVTHVTNMNKFRYVRPQS